MSRNVAVIAKEVLDKAVELSRLGAELVEQQKRQSGVDNTDLGKWLARIYEDRLLTNIEFQQLRDEADRKVDALKSLYPKNSDLAGFQSAADVAVQIMQTGILGFKRQKVSGQAMADINEAYGFQVAYIKACLDRFTQMT